MSGLDMNKVSAHAADNASVNYGKHKGVYQKMKCFENKVIAATFLARILRNATECATCKTEMMINYCIQNV